MYTLASIFDYSGNWSEPFRKGGWNVVQIDKLIGYDILDVDSVEVALEVFDSVHGIIAAPPCTDFTVSGNRFWKEKDEDGRTQESMNLVNQVLKLVNLFWPSCPDYIQESEEPFFWVMENPVGRLNSLFPSLGRPVYFDPYEFTGWCNLTAEDINHLDLLRSKEGLNITKEEAQFILDCNAYTKKTGLWGVFNSDMTKKPIEPVKGSPHGSPLLRFGGSSQATKQARSVTPIGFARAFYEANKNFIGYRCLDRQENQISLF